MNEPEKIIYQKRFDEARRENYFGITGKFAKIARYLGQQITNHSVSPTSIYQQLDTLYGNEEDGPDIPAISAEDNIFIVGYLFDGLRHGKNLEIRLLTESVEIKVSLDGDIVYHEDDNKLYRFKPSTELDETVNMLYKAAIVAEEQYKIKKAEEKQIKNDKKAKNYLQKLIDNWGL